MLRSRRGGRDRGNASAERGVEIMSKAGYIRVTFNPASISTAFSLLFASMPAQILVTISAGIILSLGLAHLAYTFIGNKFHPRDAELLVQLKATSPVISRQTSMWKAWIGFNASHSLGAILFGVVFGYLALQQPTLLFHSYFLGSLGLIVLLAYLVMAKLYWFIRPLQGVSLALVLYVLGFILAIRGASLH